MNERSSVEVKFVSRVVGELWMRVLKSKAKAFFSLGDQCGVGSNGFTL